MIVDLFFIVAAIVVLITIYKLKFSKENLHKEIKEATKKQQEKVEKSNQKEQENTGGNLTEQSASWVNAEEEDSQEQEQGPIDLKKKMKKEQKLKEKQQKKEAHEWFLKEEREKRQKADKEAEQRQRKEEQLRRKEEEVIAQLKQQERIRKEKEFNKWKDMFKVESEGQEKLSQEQEKKRVEAFNNQFINMLRKHKLLLLEDLSHKFKLSTKELVDKIKELENKGQISGIFDERGKYLVIEDSEWCAIKNYINARGRVKKTDIMSECAKLIKIPDQVEQDLLDLIKDDEKVCS